MLHTFLSAEFGTCFAIQLVNRPRFVFRGLNRKCHHGFPFTIESQEEAMPSSTYLFLSLMFCSQHMQQSEVEAEYHDVF